jgi:hypothetical protein
VKREDRTFLMATFVCRNQRGKEVLTGQVRGFIRD